jgi:hypothetical protein
VKILRRLVILLAGLLALRCSIGDLVESSLRCDKKWLSAQVTLAGATDLRSIARGLRSRGHQVGEHLNLKDESPSGFPAGEKNDSDVTRNWIDVWSNQFAITARVSSVGTKTYVEMHSDKVHCAVPDQDLRRAGSDLARDINLTKPQYAEFQKHLEIKVKHRGMHPDPRLF